MKPLIPYEAALRLSPREYEILLMVGEGYITKEIASTLHLSKKTIESHYQNMRDKLGLDQIDRIRVFGAQLRFHLHHQNLHRVPNPEYGKMTEFMFTELAPPSHSQTNRT